jgi:predicted AAA+ superfamily ATPase
VKAQAPSCHHYLESPKDLNYWRSFSKIEVDFVVEGNAAISVESTKAASPKHMHALCDKRLFILCIIVSRDERKRVTEDGVLTGL